MPVTLAAFGRHCAAPLENFNQKSPVHPHSVSRTVKCYRAEHLPYEHKKLPCAASTMRRSITEDIPGTITRRDRCHYNTTIAFEGNTQHEYKSEKSYVDELSAARFVSSMTCIGPSRSSPQVSRCV